ncbi:hypothetical protein CP_0798 [Chlamydia pneumoniae AR39]|uniref:Uncharacterized protein n=1 Tax=Chlamydia pneumoniae TaxID=83558 RepID=Q9K1Y0_CHLPN|nr:hypothetical protein CP_0798 [Chlamydia pneumoniae AR39]
MDLKKPFLFEKMGMAFFIIGRTKEELVSLKLLKK